MSKKIEEASHGKSSSGRAAPHTRPTTAQDIGAEEKVNDLRVIINEKLEFGDHTKKKKSYQEMSDHENFHDERRKAEMKMFNAFIRRRIKYCCVVWSPAKQSDSNKMEETKKHFISKTKGLEHMNYHERMVRLELERIERHMITYAS